MHLTQRSMVVRSLIVLGVAAIFAGAVTRSASAAGGPTNFVSMFRTSDGQCYADLYRGGTWNPNGSTAQNDANEEAALGRGANEGRFMGVRPEGVAARQAPPCSSGE